MKQISGIRHIQVETVLVQARLQSRSLPAPVSSRVKERIFPARVGMAPPGDRRAGRLFPVAAHAEHGPDGQLVMPGFQHGRQAPALPLALYGLGLGAGMGLGKGAVPLALRLWATSILLTMQPDRHGNQPVALETPLRQLRAELHPGAQAHGPPGIGPS